MTGLAAHSGASVQDGFSRFRIQQQRNQLGGFILDRWGIRLSAILFGLLVTSGGVLTSLGASDVLAAFAR